MLFDLRKAPLDQARPSVVERAGAGRIQPRAQGLHHRRVGPHFDPPPLGVARAGGPHRAVGAAAAVAFDPLALFQRVAFVLQWFSARTGHGAGGRVVVEVLGGVRIVARGFAVQGRHQHGAAPIRCRLQVGPGPVAAVGQGGGLGGGHADVGARLLDHRHELAGVGFLAGGVAGDEDVFFRIDHRLGVVGEAVGITDFHDAGFRFNRVMVAPPVGRQLGQTLFDFLTQGLAFGQTRRQARAGRGHVRVFCNDFEFGLVQGGVESGQEFFHALLAPAGAVAGGGLNLGAVQGLQGQAHGAGAHGQLDGLFEDGAEGLFVVAPEAPERVVVGGQEAAQPDQREDFAAGGFEPARGANAEKVAVEPDFEQEAGGVGRTALGGGGDDEVEGGQVELLDEFAQEAHGVVGGHPVLQGGRKEKLLAVIRRDDVRHGHRIFSGRRLFKDLKVLRQFPAERRRLVFYEERMRRSAGDCLKSIRAPLPGLGTRNGGLGKANSSSRRPIFSARRSQLPGPALRGQGTEKPSAGVEPRFPAPTPPPPLRPRPRSGFAARARPASAATAPAGSNRRTTAPIACARLPIPTRSSAESPRVV